MRIAIIGGSGSMGRWFARHLSEDGYDVVITGRNKEKLQAAGRKMGVATASNAAAIENADAVLISVPPDNFEQTIVEIKDCIRPGQIVLDITSIKSAPVEIMHKYIKNGLVLGTHPMFGPGARDIANQNIILTPTGEPEAVLAQKIKERLEAKGARVALMSPQEHDETISIVLGLTHLIALVSADTLMESERLKLASTVSGSTYKTLLTLVGSVLLESPEFSAYLQMNLPKTMQFAQLLEEKAQFWLELIKDKDRERFIKRMNALKEGLQKSGLDLGKAYQNMYRIVEAPREDQLPPLP